MKRKWGKGITLTGLLFIGAIVCLLVVVLIPVTCTTTCQNYRRQACGQSLGSIGRGMLQYSGIASESALMLPMIADPNGTGRNPNAKIANIVGTDDPNLPIAELGGRGNINAMQNFWPLITRSICPENHFQCPADKGYKARPTLASSAPSVTDKKYGWTNMNQFSYGVQWCYPGADNKNACDPVSVDMDEMAVIMADRNPGGAVSEKGAIIKPSNHTIDIGENVLYRGGSAKWYDKTTDSKIGKSGDDIYVNNAGLIGPPTARPGMPGSEAFDTIIVPAYAGDANTGRGK